MTGKIKALFIFIILMVANGCAGNPVISTQVYKTPIAPFTSTPLQPQALPENSSLSATVVVASTFPPPANVDADFSPILYGKKYDANTFFILLGGVERGQWILPEEAAAKIKGTMQYDVYPSTKEMFQVLGYPPASAPIHPGQYFIRTDATYDDFGMVGVARGWPVSRGKLAELSPDNETYKQVVLDWLKGAGLPDPQLGLMEILRVDLEGDGVDEIFISARHLDESEHTTRAGDYSIVLVRKVVGNNVATLPIVADIYQSQSAEITYPKTYSLANFIDLNKDGTLEVVIDYHRWEEDGAMIYTIGDQGATQVP